jgi:hypothetical protein
MNLPLIAVVGPVEPDLLTAFTTHYTHLGVTRFVLGFHFPDHTDPDLIDTLTGHCRDLVGGPTIVSHGPWHEHTNNDLRDRLRRHAGPGWHLIADSDELHTYPTPPHELIAHAASAGRTVVGGLMLDRVAADGTLAGWTPPQGLDAAYPLGGFLTHRLLRGDPRKIVLARADAPLAAGNHRSPGQRPANGVPVLVHHFKWRAGVQPYLRQREAMLTSGTWQHPGGALRDETSRLLAHLASTGGRLATSHPAWPLRPVTVDRVPAWWAGEATHIVTTWRPPTAQPDGP